MNYLANQESNSVSCGTLYARTPEEGRDLAISMARQTIRTIQPDMNVLQAGRIMYSVNPDSLIAASQVVAIEFQTIAAANNYWCANHY